MSLPIPDVFDDTLFDRHYPLYVRERSREFWTPVAVAAHAAAAFAVHQARRILDVGCGPGKFCIVAGCLHPQLEIHGVEQRPRLVRLGRTLARRLDARNVRFWTADATRLSWDQYDGLYFFNPFSENVFDEVERFDNEVDLSRTRFSIELLRVENLLAQARIGTVVVTYHGLGGAIPSSYELVADERAGSDHVRTWVQRSQQRRPWAWLETETAVVRVSQGDMRAVLASLLYGDSSGNDLVG